MGLQKVSIPLYIQKPLVCNFSLFRSSHARIVVKIKINCVIKMPRRQIWFQFNQRLVRCLRKKFFEGNNNAYRFNIFSRTSQSLSKRRIKKQQELLVHVKNHLGTLPILESAVTLLQLFRVTYSLLSLSVRAFFDEVWDIQEVVL